MFNGIFLVTCISVVPLLLLFCLCGGMGGKGQFKAIPFGAKEQLIAYHTEGRGEDKLLDINPVRSKTYTETFTKAICTAMH